jgi:hypothetical protein
VPGTSPYEVIAGIASVYLAPFDTPFPATNGTPSSPWVALGRTEGGVHVRLDQEVKLLRSDIHSGAVGAIRTSEALEITFSLVDLTVENMARALNDATVTTGGAPTTRSIPLVRQRLVAKHALLVRGDSPYGNFNAQWEVPRVINTDSIELDYTKDDKAVLATKWIALEDTSVSNEKDRFGFFRAQSA